MFDAIGIVTKDMDKTIKFYESLGLKFEQFEDSEHYEAKTENGTRLMLDSFDLMKRINPEYSMPKKSSITLCFKKESAKEVNELFAKVKSQGFDFLKEPWDAFWGQRYACIVDPNGNQVDIFSDSL